MTPAEKSVEKYWLNAAGLMMICVLMSALVVPWLGFCWLVGMTYVNYHFTKPLRPETQ